MVSSAFNDIRHAVTSQHEVAMCNVDVIGNILGK